MRRVTVGAVLLLAPALLAAAAPPMNLTVAPGDGKLDVGWAEPADPPTGYDVHYTSSAAAADDAEASGSDPSAGWVDAGHAGTQTRHALTGLTNGRAYRVRVRAVYAKGAGPWAAKTGTPRAPFWSAELTVAEFDGRDRGCRDGARADADSTSAEKPDAFCSAALTKNAVTWEGAEYRITEVVARPLAIALDRQIPGRMLSVLCLWLDGSAFCLRDCELSAGGMGGANGNLNQASWAGREFAWTVGQRVSLSLFDDGGPNSDDGDPTPDDDEDDEDDDDGGGGGGDEDEDDGGGGDTDNDDDDGGGGGGDIDDDESACTLVAPFWSGPTGGFTVRPEEGSNSVRVACGGTTTEYAAGENGLVTRLVRSSCPGGLRVEGASPGGWYWQHGERNAAAAPLVCSEALGGPPAVVPGGVAADARDDGTWFKHDTARLVGIVPHLAGNECGEYVTPYWQGRGGVVIRPAEGRSTARVRVQCGGTSSTMTPSAGEDGVIAELVRKDYCTDDEGEPRQGKLTVTGAAPGGWYWISGERNAAVAPLMCADLLGGPAAVGPGGVLSRATEDGTYFRHDTNRLIGVVPHVASDRGGN